MDGLASTDNDSSTADISQDGYASGELNGIRIDQSGTLVGSFTNGRSLGLAQVGVAKFANNEGLASEGGNFIFPHGKLRRPDHRCGSDGRTRQDLSLEPRDE